jgi:hypothetical protein
MISTLMDVASTRRWQAPFLLLYLVGLFIAISRRDLGRAQSFAVIGFAILIVSVLLHAVQMYQALSDGGYRVVGARVRAFTLVITTVRAAGFALVMTALFIDRGNKTPSPQQPDSK